MSGVLAELRHLVGNEDAVERELVDSLEAKTYPIRPNGLTCSQTYVAPGIP